MNLLCNDGAHDLLHHRVTGEYEKRRGAFRHFTSHLTDELIIKAQLYRCTEGFAGPGHTVESVGYGLLFEVRPGNDDSVMNHNEVLPS